MIPPPPRSTLFPYTTLFRSQEVLAELGGVRVPFDQHDLVFRHLRWIDGQRCSGRQVLRQQSMCVGGGQARVDLLADEPRSEEHTSELQSRLHLVCRLLLEKK